MVESFRKYDMNAEQEIAKFLDSHLYNKPEFSEFKRFYSKEEQLKGKDVIFTFNELKEIIVDEKAQIYYINKNLPTFAFEIDFIRKGNMLTTGWLFDNDKETQYYLLIWITAKKERNIVSEDIEQLECILVKRLNIIEFLNQQELTKEKCEEISKEIRTQNKTRAQKRGEFNSCYFFYSDYLAEKPVNVIIRKDKLKELSKEIFTAIP